MNGKEVIKRLEAAGWRVARIQGSHHILIKPGVPRSVPVPVHGSRDLSSGLIKAIERQSGDFMNVAYPYTLTPQPEGGFLVQFVDLEEAFTEGDTEEQAAFNAAEALTGVLAVRLEQGEDIPPPSPADGRPVALPDAPVQAALLIHFARQGHSLSELARAMGTSWPAAQRLTRPGNPTLRQLERAAAALGKRLVLSLE